MPPNKSAKNTDRQKDQLRLALANETAKIIAVEGVRDFHRAKIKASERLGNSQHGSLPSNLEIEQAITSFQKTFAPNHEQSIATDRKIALIIMQWLQEFSPFLVGPVLEGTAGVNTPISIHISCDTVEGVLEVFQNNDIEIRLVERRLKLNNKIVFLPTVSFEYQENEVEVLVFSLRQQYQQPKSKTQNRCMQRINIKTLEQLLATS